MTPEKLGNVWTARARIQRITKDYKWETLAVCMDTPNSILAEARKLQSQGYDWNTLWVRGDATPRKMVNEL